MPAKHGKAFEVALMKFHLSSSSSSSSIEISIEILINCENFCRKKESEGFVRGDFGAHATWEQKTKSKMPLGAKLNVSNTSEQK